MKTLRVLVMSFAIIILMACEKENVNEDFAIESTYMGTLSFSETFSSSPLSSSHGITTVTININEEILVHCYGGELDTTFMLNYYEHNDSVLVCLTGEAFEYMYGHELGQGHMTGHSNSGETSWEHHLNDEHVGGFQMGNHSFNYSIETPMGYYHFNGTKK